MWIHSIPVSDSETTRLYQALALLRVNGYEVGKYALCDGVPRIAIDCVLKTYEDIIAMADQIRKPPAKEALVSRRRRHL